MRKGQGKKGPAKPEGWPSNPQPVKLTLGASFPQTGLRNIENKPPFLRCVINQEVMAVNGIHTDLPLEIECNGKSIVVHAWPDRKLAKTSVLVDDAVRSYLGIKSDAKVGVELKPVDQFNAANRVVVRNCPDATCRVLPAVYDGIVVKSGSVVFYGNRRYEVEVCENEYQRVSGETVFVSSNFERCDVPVSLEEQFQRLNGLIDPKKKKAVLIYGPTGCGKTNLVSAVLTKRPELTSAVVSIPSLLSGAFGAAEKALRRIRDRNVVVLENAEILGTDEVSRRLIAGIADICEHTSVIVTTIDFDSFPKTLKQSNRISEFIEIQAPSAEDRFKILKGLCGSDFAEEDAREAANSATGFVAGDLQRLVSEAIVENLTLTKSLAKVKPASLRHITLEIPEVHWNDIGGYEDVKTKLQESVTLPLEKPECFTRLGIRPPRGVLLFGPPGCSKTLMAKAVATESKMNFIAVKGPELFSKFVGESEKAVASVFKKARNAAPSIIFFDEIDAMATKRGASGDSGSNVADRVLTQLLTEMDGVQTRFDQSVVVIAATNRPDLLDPALMRPGRFDRLIYVSLPNEAARQEIFNVHVRKMKFADGIDTSSLAKSTDGYSGAEIAAVCREAAMNALREDPPAPEVTLSHVNLALEAVKPRTPQQLIQWYQSFESQRKY